MRNRGGAIERLRATDEDVVDGDVDELDNVANDTWYMLVVVLLSSLRHHVPMIRKPMPTACEMRMNSFLSGSGGVLVRCSSADEFSCILLVQRFKNRVPSLRNSAGILRKC